MDRCERFFSRVLSGQVLYLIYTILIPQVEEFSGEICTMQID